MSSITIGFEFVNVATTASISDSSATGTGSHSEGVWALVADSMVYCHYDDYPYNLSWEHQLLKTGIVSSNFFGYYYLMGYPIEAIGPTQKNLIIDWTVQALSDLGYCVEISSDCSRISVTFFMNTEEGSD